MSEVSNIIGQVRRHGKEGVSIWARRLASFGCPAAEVEKAFMLVLLVLLVALEWFTSSLMVWMAARRNMHLDSPTATTDAIDHPATGFADPVEAVADTTGAVDHPVTGLADPVEAAANVAASTVAPTGTADLVLLSVTGPADSVQVPAVPPVNGILRRRSSSRLPVMTLACLVAPGATEASKEFALTPYLKQAKFGYGKPPCAQHCGYTPSQCVDQGWFHDDVYYMWYDKSEKFCKHFKVAAPRKLLEGAVKSAFWGNVFSLAVNLADGFQPSDLLTLYYTNKVSQEYEEVFEDLQLIEQKLLGVLPGDHPSDKEEL